MTEGMYADRLDALRDFAADEGGVVNDDSVRSFLQFVSDMKVNRRGSLVLNLDNEVCALWENESNGESVECEFHADGNVLYMFSKCTDDDSYATGAKTATSDGFLARVQEEGLGYLLFG